MTPATPNTHVLWIRLRSTAGPWKASPELRPKLVADAKKAKSNLNDVAIGILSAHYTLPFEPSGRHTTPGKKNTELNLRISAALHRALEQEGARHTPMLSKQDVAIRVLHEHYALTAPASASRAA